MAVFDKALRIVTFLLHFASAIFLLAVCFRCGDNFIFHSYLQSATERGGFAVITDNPCTDPHEWGCFFGIPQSYDVLQHGYEWNAIGLLAAFEWLSASFALFYLKDALWVDSHSFRCFVNVGCLLWNVAGIALFMPFSLRLTMLQAGVTGLALVSAIAIQWVGETKVGLQLDPSHEEDSLEWEALVLNQTTELPPRERVFYYGGGLHDGGAPPVKRYGFKQGGVHWVIPKSPNDPADTGALDQTHARQAQKQGTQQGRNLSQTDKAEHERGARGSEVRVTHHYSEYCASASLLLVAVIILFIVGPLTWASQVAFTGILLCNLTGIAAHLSKLDQHAERTTSWLNLDWTKTENHFKLFMLHSWSALILSVFVVVYFGWVDLTNDGVPLWVRFILWNLLVTYSLFGFWATLCYAMAGSKTDPERFQRWMTRLDYGLTVLSLAAKLPVAFTVYYGLVAQPGGGGCS